MKRLHTLAFEPGLGRRQRAVLDSTTSFGIILTDRDGSVTEWNIGAERILGWSAEEMCGCDLSRIFTPEDKASDRAGTEMRLSLEHGRADDERWHLRKDNSRFWASGEMMPLRDDDGAHIGYVKVLRDQTSEHEAGEALEETARRLRESEDHYRHTVELNPQVPWTCDPAGNITSYSKRWLELTGQAPGEPLGAGWAKALHPDDVPHTMEAFAASLGAGEPVDVDYRIFDAAAGEHRWMRARAYPRRDEHGNVIQWYGIVEDIHDRKLQGEELALLNATLEDQVERRTRELIEAEDALRQSQKLEAVGQLTGGVAHDFNNLLTIIRSSVDFLRRPDLPEDRRRRYMDAVSDTVDRAAKLTGQLLAFARRQSLNPQVFDVGERLRAIADMLDTVTGARIRIATKVPSVPCYVRADQSQFETALVNIAVNARDAGRPYAESAYGREWRVVARAAGVPDNVWNMDARAGAITEAEDAGADLDHIRSAAAHSQTATTQRYSRGALGKSRHVAELRIAHRAAKIETGTKQEADGEHHGEHGEHLDRNAHSKKSTMLKA
ncbi:PAS domain S-box protein [Methylobacterium sp. C25]|uniref:PAS domain-containing sensor histidine kinase n=1 Tax=Methylobacterium sp. C25 TaxID=2721622 RepID=UPI003FA3A8E9